MTRKNKQKKTKIEKHPSELKHQQQKCPVSEEPNDLSTGTILGKDFETELLADWPKLKLKVPPIFLHKPTNIEQHVKKILNMGIKFYQPLLGKNYIKITCQTNTDHKNLVHFFEKKQIPFHTFGIPSKRKMKVVIRGIPKDTDLNKIKAALKSVSIPIIRVHKMHTKEERKDNTMLVLAVVPYDEEGKVILKLTQVLGHDVKLERPIPKPKQCYRCQKWGHSQRYCHGPVKCVKCGEEHLSKKCNKSKEDPPKCANCKGDHTANYKNCIFTPGSEGYKMMQSLKTVGISHYRPLQLVTMENCHDALYRNVFFDIDSSFESI